MEVGKEPSSTNFLPFFLFFSLHHDSAQRRKLLLSFLLSLSSHSLLAQVTSSSFLALFFSQSDVDTQTEVSSSSRRGVCNSSFVASSFHYSFRLVVRFNVS